MIKLKEDPLYKTTCEDCGQLKDSGPYSNEIKRIGDHAICTDCIAFHKYDLGEYQNG